MHLIRRSIGVLSQANTIFRMMTVMWSLSLSVMGIGLSVANQTKTESLNYGFTAVPCVATHQSIQITAPVVGQRWTEVHMSSICPHNAAVLCDGQGNCQRCGWNPKVSEIRRGKLQNVGTVFEKGKNPGRFVRGEEQRNLTKIIKGRYRFYG